MGIKIGAKPDSGFDDPLGMLTDCHRRIEHFLHILCLVAARARGRQMTEEETEAVEAALTYFQVGGKRHNADEEESLFPRLRTRSAANELEELEGLESDHQHAGELHAAIEEKYRSWIAAGSLSTEDAEHLTSATEQLIRLYEEHIRTEERIVFPRAAEALDREEVEAVGQEFRARRQ